MKMSMKMSDSEIRLKVLESKEFAYAAGEQLRDNLTNEQAALLGYYLFGKAGSPDDFYIYALECIAPIMKQVLNSEIDDYNDRHCINEETDDCSAFKEHLDMNPERYK